MKKEEALREQWHGIGRPYRGGMGQALKAIGYRAKWDPGEKRLLPDWLARKLAADGAALCPPSETDAEKRVVAPPAPAPKADWLSEAREQYKTETRVKVLCPDGWNVPGPVLSEKMRLAGYVLPWRRTEIRELPASLAVACREAHVSLTMDPAEIGQYDTQKQARFVAMNREALAAKDAERAASHAKYEARAKAEAEEARKAARREELGI